MTYSFIAFKVEKWDEKLGKNVQNPHAKMNNLSLRKAMLHAMNIDQVNQRFFRGLDYRVNSLIPAQFGKFHDAKVPVYSSNLEKANKLLDQAGYKKDKQTGYRLQPNGKS